MKKSELKDHLRDRFIEEINRMWPEAMSKVLRAENKLSGVEEQEILQSMASYAEAYFFGALAAVRENLAAEKAEAAAQKAFQKAEKAAQRAAAKEGR
jgi:hypothetical protein